MKYLNSSADPFCVTPFVKYLNSSADPFTDPFTDGEEYTMLWPENSTAAFTVQ